MRHSDPNAARNYKLDLLRFICACLVIMIHISFAEHDAVNPLTRIAVPIFFMISGYFYSCVRSRNAERRQIKKIALLTALGTLLHFTVYTIIELFGGNSLLGWLGQNFTLKSAIELLFFNVVPFSAPLWYLLALLYVLITVWLFEKLIPRKYLYCAIPILLLCNLCLGAYAIPLLGHAPDLFLSRNFLFAGLPFFLLGDYLFTHKDNIRIPNVWLILFAVYAAVTSYCERYVLALFGMCEHEDLYVGTVLMSLAVFLIAVNPGKSQPKLWVIKLSTWARQLSLPMYLSHTLINSLLYAIVVGLSLPSLSVFYTKNPIYAVLPVTVAVAAVWVLLKTAVAKRLPQKRAA